MSPDITEDERAKDVVASNGDRIGIVSAVRDGTAYVDPESDIDGQLKTKLGWGATEKDEYPLRADAVDEVTDDEIRLRSDY